MSEASDVCAALSIPNEQPVSGFSVSAISGPFIDVYFFNESAGAEALYEFSAVPIPAAAWLFGSALLGLGFVKRRKA